MRIFVTVSGEEEDKEAQLTPKPQVADHSPETTSCVVCVGCV